MNEFNITYPILKLKLEYLKKELPGDEFTVSYEIKVDKGRTFHIFCLVVKGKGLVRKVVVSCDYDFDLAQERLSDKIGAILAGIGLTKKG